MMSFAWRTVGWAIVLAVGFATWIVAGSGSAWAQCDLGGLDVPEVGPHPVYDVATDGTYAAVGYASSDVVLVLRQERATWVPEQRVEGPVDSGLGRAVALVDGWLAVGATTTDGGRVYLYRREATGWELRTTLESPGPADSQYFGLQLFARDGRLLVLQGSGFDMDVHLFRRDANDVWSLESSLTRVPMLWRGAQGSLSADGRSVALAERGFDGLVYELVGSTWVQRLRLEGGQGSIAIHGDRLASGITIVGNRQRVQLYERVGDAWVESALLQASDSRQNDGFGSRLAMGDDRLVVGSNDALYAFRFVDGTWVETAKFAVGETFATTLELAGDSLVVMTMDGRFRAFDIGAEDCTSLCRGGAVNAIAGAVDMLFLNGETGAGASNREITIGATDPWLLWMLRPPAGGSGAFLVHANLGAPNASDPVTVPLDTGLVCFTPFLPAGAMPAAIWNGLGRESRLGASRYFDGSPQPDPAPAPAFLLQLDAGDSANLPPGTTVTFQGLLRDPIAVGRAGVSPTNALVVHVE